MALGLFICAKTVPELDLLKPPELLFERKQIPRFVVNIRNSRKTMGSLEATKLPWAHPGAKVKIAGHHWAALEIGVALAA